MKTYDQINSILNGVSSWGNYYTYKISSQEYNVNFLDYMGSMGLALANYCKRFYEPEWPSARDNLWHEDYPNLKEAFNLSRVKDYCQKQKWNINYYYLDSVEASGENFFWHLYQPWAPNHMWHKDWSWIPSNVKLKINTKYGVDGWTEYSSWISGELTRAEGLLNQVEQVSKVQEENTGLTSQVGSLEQELTGINCRDLETQGELTQVQNTVNSFNIATKINPLSAAKKGHLLQKIWQATDELSKSIVSIIKTQSFDPHYVNGSNVSLVQTAIGRNDSQLFDLLVSKGLKFTQVSKTGKTFFAIVQDAGKDGFTKKMLDTKQDFSKPLAKLVMEGNAAKLGKIFDLDPSQTKTMCGKYSLLQVAIVNKKQDVVKQILTKDPLSAKQLTSDGVSTTKVALITGNDEALKLLVDKGADLKSDMLGCLKRNQVEQVKKILTLKPDMLSQVASSLSETDASNIFNANKEVLKIYDSKGQNLFYYSLINKNFAVAKLLLSVDPGGLKDSQGKHILLDILQEDTGLQTKIDIFKAVLDFGVQVPNASDLADELAYYPDIALDFEAHNYDFMGN
jgi:hypothetical protein